MNQEISYSFLKVKDGRTYFARVFVRADSTTTNGNVTIAADAGAGNPHTPNEWLHSAVAGAKAAIASYDKLHRGAPAITIMTVMGTEVDTTPNSVEVAAFCAAWKALGGDEDRLKFEFDNEWRVQVQAD